MKQNLEATIYDEHEKPIHVTGVFIKGMASNSRDSPDDEDEHFITGATDHNGYDAELTEDQEEDAMKEFYTH